MFLTPMLSFIHRQIVLLLIIPVLLIIVGWLIYYRSPQEFLTNPDLHWKKVRANPFQFSSGTDPEIHVVKFDTASLVYSYRLMDALQPDAEIALFQKDKGYIDLSPYDQIQLKLRSKNAKRVPFELLVLEKNRKDKNGKALYRQLLMILDVTTTSQTLTIPLKEMTTPRWWYSVQGLTETEVDKPDFSNVIHLGFGNDKIFIQNDKTVKQASIEVASIRFLRSMIPLYYYTVALLFLFAALCLLYLWSRKRKGREIVISYDHIEAQNRDIQEWELILTYLSENYLNQELSLTTIQAATGLHERRISALIKKETSHSFKQYLNNLRIKEAKAFLEAGQLSISEIAFRSGYGNVTHFNKVFKATEGCAPKDYRREQTSLDIKTE